MGGAGELNMTPMDIWQGSSNLLPQGQALLNQLAYLPASGIEMACML